MKNFILGCLTGIAISGIAFFIWQKNHGGTNVNEPVSIVRSAGDSVGAITGKGKRALPGAFPKIDGDKLIKDYETMATKPVDCNSFVIDGEGFSQIVNDSRFNGFRIYLGKDPAGGKNSVKLLLCGLATNNSLYYYKDALGADNYLDRVDKCPNPLNPACN